jgi:hypothetical protein
MKAVHLTTSMAHAALAEASSLYLPMDCNNTDMIAAVLDAVSAGYRSGLVLGLASGLLSVFKKIEYRNDAIAP